MHSSDGYKTRQREIIENCLKENRNIHMTVDDIVLSLSKNNAPVGRTTVYRTLEKMVKENKVRKYVTGNNDSACFQYLEKYNDCHNHFHLKCVDCGKLLHVDCEKINQLSKHIADEHEFSIDMLQTVIYGKCKMCGEGQK